MITGKVIADSIGQDAPRVTTLELTYPRFIHAEFMTHRVFSRNASSSRAIPVDRMIRDIQAAPAYPEYWVMNEPGMQGYTIADAQTMDNLNALWEEGLEHAIGIARRMQELNAHKQHINRVLEPWMHIKVVVTSVYWDNFVGLRNHPAAEPTMQYLGRLVNDLLLNSAPQHIERGEWHLPYVDDETRQLVQDDVRTSSYNNAYVRQEVRSRLKAISAARCARTSYNNFEGKKSTWEEDLALFEKLTVQPLHASPLEHQLSPDWVFTTNGRRSWSNEKQHGNTPGWKQHRKEFPSETLDEAVRAPQR